MKTASLLSIVFILSAFTAAEKEQSGSSSAVSLPCEFAVVGRPFVCDLSKLGNEQNFKVTVKEDAALPPWLSFDEEKSLLVGVPLRRDKGELYLDVQSKKDSVKHPLKLEVKDLRDAELQPRSNGSQLSSYARPTCPKAMPVAVATLIFDLNITKLTGEGRVNLMKRVSDFVDVNVRNLHMSAGKGHNTAFGLKDVLLVTAGPGNEADPKEPGVVVSWQIGCGFDLAGAQVASFLKSRTETGAFDHALVSPLSEWHITIGYPKEPRKRARRQLVRKDTRKPSKPVRRKNVVTPTRALQATPTPTMTVPLPSSVVSRMTISVTRTSTVVATTSVVPTTEEPTTTEQSTTTEEPSTTEEPTSTPLPSTTEEPTTTPLPSTTEESTTTPPLFTTEEPITTPLPSTTEEPTTTPLPSTTEEPTTTPLPSTTEEPTTTPLPSTTEESTTTPLPSTTEEPTTTPLPITTEEPTTTPLPSTTEESTTTPLPSTTEEPTTTPLPSTTEEPTTTPLPSTTEKPTTTPLPSTTEESTTTPPLLSTTKEPTTIPLPSTTEEPTTTPLSDSTTTPLPSTTEEAATTPLTRTTEATTTERPDELSTTPLTSTTDETTPTKEEQTTPLLPETTQQPDTKPDTKPANKEPGVVNHVDRLNVYQGQGLWFPIPADTFYDKEDGYTPNLALSLKTIGWRSTPEWIQFDPSSQVIYALPLKEKWIGLHEFVLVAADKQGWEAYDAFEVDVMEDVTSYNHQFTVQIDYDHANFSSDLAVRLLLLDKLAKYFNVNMTNIRVESFRAGSVFFTFRFDFVPYDVCFFRSRDDFLSDGEVNPNFKKALLPEFPVISGTFEGVGPCGDVVGPDVGAVGGRPSGAWETYAIVPVIVLALVLFIIGGLLLLVWRCRRKQRLSEEDKQTFVYKRKPAVLQEEYEVKEQLLKQPLVLPNEKPPHSPPFSPRNPSLTPSANGPELAPGYQQPSFTSSRQPSNSVGPGGNNVRKPGYSGYRLPPAYVPP